MLGWGPSSLMVDLIKELDHGLSALPKGSEVVFVNMHNPHDSLGQALQHVNLENVQVCGKPCAERLVSEHPACKDSQASVVHVSSKANAHSCACWHCQRGACAGVLCCRCAMSLPTRCSAALWQAPWMCPCSGVPLCCVMSCGWTQTTMTPMGWTAWMNQVC